MPANDVTITANYITVYDVYVNGTQVTENNKDDILGDGSKKVRYDPDSNTLTLNGATINANDRGIETQNSDLNLVLTGDNTVTSTNSTTIMISGKLTISGGGSLTANNVYGMAIVANELSVSDSTVSCKSTNDYAIETRGDSGITVNSGANLTGESGNNRGIGAKTIVVNAGGTLTGISTSTNPDHAGFFIPDSGSGLTLNTGGSVTASGPMGIYFGSNVPVLNYNGGTLRSTSTASGNAALMYWTSTVSNEALSPVINAASYDWRTGTSDAFTISDESAFALNGSSYAELREGSWSYSLATTASANDTIQGTRTSSDQKTTLTPTVTVTAPTGDLTYDGTEKSAAVNVSSEWTAYGLATPTTISYTRDGEAFSGTPKDAGSYTASITYEGQTASVTYEIAKVVPTLTWSGASLTLTYTGSAAQVTAPTVTLTGGETYDESANGAISYSYQKTGDDAYTAGLPTEPGTYLVKATLAAQGNYAEASTTADLTLTIEAPAEDTDDADDDDDDDDTAAESTAAGSGTATGSAAAAQYSAQGTATGDTTDLLPWVIAAIVCAGGAVTVLVMYKRRKDADVAG